MHYLIGIISEESTKEEACESAFDFADSLVEQNDFDYHTYAGRTYKLTSGLGQEAVAGALAATREDFMRAMQVVRFMLDQYTDEHIYQEDFGAEDPERPREYYLSRWQFAQVGTTRTYLYATQGIWGEAFTNDKDYAPPCSQSKTRTNY